MNFKVIDANINRLSEGLRVIEEYVRFIISDQKLSLLLSDFRKQVNLKLKESYFENISIRDTSQDARATDTPVPRKDLKDLLIANFKRAQEASRVLEEYTSETFFNKIRYSLYDLEKEIMMPFSKNIQLEGIYVISDDVDTLTDALDYPVAMIQLRAKTKTKQEIYNMAKLIAPLAKEKGIPFIINDYVDLAMLLDVAGVHCGQDDISTSTIRRIIGEGKLIGRTTHSLEQGIEAQKDGADYISVGPIWETPSKPNRDGIGFDYLEVVKQHIHIPYVAIGGINLENINQVLPFKPPMIGIIRAFKDIKQLLKVTQN